MAKARIERVNGNLYEIKLDPHSGIGPKESQAEALFQEGLAAEDALQFDAALECYRRAIALNPNAAGILANIGNIFYKRQNYGVAEEYFRKAIEVDPYYPLARFNLGNVFDEKGLFGEAAEQYEVALALNPFYLDPRFNVALVYSRIGRTSDAVRHWRAYLKYATSDTPFWRKIAVRELARLEKPLLQVVPNG